MRVKMNSRPEAPDAGGERGGGTTGIHFPEPTEEDVVALRAARRSVAGTDVWRLLEQLQGPTMKELRQRKITLGEPFRWRGSEEE